MGRIYTRRGDDGWTDRPGGQRVPKDHPLVAAGGALEELSAHVGLCLQQAGAAGAETIARALAPVQAELMSAGAAVAHAGTSAAPHAGPDDGHVERIERTIDDVWASLPAPGAFVLPGGCQLACRLHVARTVCRRAERAVVAAADGADVPPAVAGYLNRLGDLLFALSRAANRDAGVAEEPWPC
jgi:cob(I)alamin adenosyltransferase